MYAIPEVKPRFLTVRIGCGMSSRDPTSSAELRGSRAAPFTDSTTFSISDPFMSTSPISAGIVLVPAQRASNLPSPTSQEIDGWHEGSSR